MKIVFPLILIFLLSCEFKAEAEKESNTLYINQIKYDVNFSRVNVYEDIISITFGSRNETDFISLILTARNFEDEENWANKSVTLNLGQYYYIGVENEENAFRLSSITTERIKGEFNFKYKRNMEAMHIYGKFNLQISN